MTFRKRWRVITAALFQEWHEKTCAECEAKWMALGPHTELIAICDACEAEHMDRFMNKMEQEYHRLKQAAKGAW